MKKECEFYRTKKFSISLLLITNIWDTENQNCKLF